MARWVANEGFEYAVLLDDDESGREVVSKLSSDTNYHAIESDCVFNLAPTADTVGTVLEDLFDPEIYVECLNQLYRRENHFGADGPVVVEQVHDSDDWWIDTEQYDGTGLPDVLESVFQKRSSDYMKRKVGNEIRRRIKSGEDVFKSSESKIKSTLGQLESVL
ncbi:MAG: hypothetical protein J07HB67_01999 [halophilic archaeon J07HB67]|jgi:hypothetical protein|nr:MAG: hypothetical protein J07HB67_01999 [halophilic archaeon J07HB67]